MTKPSHDAVLTCSALLVVGCLTWVLWPRARVPELPPDVEAPEPQSESLSESPHGASELESLLAEARAHPDQALPRLESALAGPLTEADLDTLIQVLAGPRPDPEVLRVALEALLPRRGELVRVWAEELARADPRLAPAVAEAVARHLPPRADGLPPPPGLPHRTSWRDHHGGPPGPDW